MARLPAGARLQPTASAAPKVGLQGPQPRARRPRIWLPAFRPVDQRLSPLPGRKAEPAGTPATCLGSVLACDRVRLGVGVIQRCVRRGCESDGGRQGRGALQCRRNSRPGKSSGPARQARPGGRRAPHCDPEGTTCLARDCRLAEGPCRAPVANLPPGVSRPASGAVPAVLLRRLGGGDLAMLVCTGARRRTFAARRGGGGLSRGSKRGIRSCFAPASRARNFLPL